MPEDPKPPSENTGYSAEYVKTLRDEAASWRTKLRDTEAKVTELETSIYESKTTNSISQELTSRNIKVDPKWITLEENQAPKDAVDKFLKEYPQFVAKEKGDFTPDPKPAPGRKPMQTAKPNTNVENTNVSDLEAIKTDPIARAKLRDHYRALLARDAGVSNQI